MQVVKLTEKEFKGVFPNPYHVFNGTDFNAQTALSKGVVPEFLAFKTTKYRMGIIGLREHNRFRSPYSAPFGGFTYAKADISLESIDASVEALVSYLKSENVTGIDIGMPPLFYDNAFISKVNNSLYRHGFEISKSDLNYSLVLEDLRDNYLAKMHHNARKNLSISLTKEFQLLLCTTTAEKQQAYTIIQQNRQARGYPLRMRFEDVLRTIDIISADFFLLKLKEDCVAAAMIFHVGEGIVQVVYWGDLPAFNANKTMNFLSYAIVNHYLKTEIKIIDIGPSTEDSQPNYGLCDFKESIGCTVYPKYTWSKSL